MTIDEQKTLLGGLYHIGVQAALPERVAPAALASLTERPTLVLAAGKATAEMAEAALVSRIAPAVGLVAARRGQGRPLGGMEVIEAAHPEPDGESVRAAERMLELAALAGPNDHILMLLSGGASALLCAPGAGLDLPAKQALTQALLGSGANVEEINLVRRHLSRIKGGRLAAAAFPARVTTLAISDVIGDAPQDIGSGPTAPDPTTVAQALAILDRYGIPPPASGWSESCKPGDPLLARSTFRVIAGAALSLAAIRDAAAAAGYQPVDLGENLQGEARVLGAHHGEIAKSYCSRGGRHALISGGELTVTVQGRGLGGPNFEYAAALARAIDGVQGVAALAGDSDGVDGNSGACGAFVFGDTAARVRAAGFSLEEALATSDAARAFFEIADGFAPGPSGTNVNDLRIILISDRQG